MLTALPLSYKSLLHRFSKNLMNTTCISPRPRSTRKEEKERNMGKNLGPWQEGEVGNDRTDRNPRRAVEDGDPARASGAILRQERETGWGKEMNGYGGVRTPLSRS